MSILVENVHVQIMDDQEWYYLLIDGVDKGLAFRKTSDNGEALTSVMSKLIDLYELQAHRNQIGTKVVGLHDSFVRTQKDLIKEGLLPTVR